MTEQARIVADEVSYPTITITVVDPDTGMTTTITGKAKVDMSTVLTPPHVELSDEPVLHTASQPSLQLNADWIEERGRHYTISRFPTPAPDSR